MDSRKALKHNCEVNIREIDNIPMSHFKSTIQCIILGSKNINLNVSNSDKIYLVTVLSCSFI